MSKKVVVTLAVVVVVALGYVAWRHAVDPPYEPADPSRLVERASDTDAGDTGEAPPRLRGTGEQHPAARAGSARVDAKAPAPSNPSGLVPPHGSKGPAKSAKPPAPITGTVKFGAWPARGGTVRILDWGAGARSEDAAAIEATIDASGRFELDAPRTGAILLSFSFPGRQSRMVHVRASAEPDDPIEVAFGEGRIFGVVRDAEGSPLADAGVRLSTYLVRGDEGYSPSAEGDVFLTGASTGPDGTYEFTDLPVGCYVLVATTVPGKHDARNIRSYKVELQEGESRRLDIGGVHYDPTWTGTVRYEDGTAVRRAGSLFVRSEDGERRMYVSFDAEGCFAQAVPPGTYRLELVFPGGGIGWGMHLVQTAQTVTVLPSGAVEDVVLPGPRVTGRVRGVPPTIETTPPALYVVFTLESTSVERPPSLVADKPTRTVRVAVAKDGTFAADGLCAGVWLVTGAPSELKGEDGRVARVTLSTGARNAELVLVHAVPRNGEGHAPR